MDSADPTSKLLVIHKTISVTSARGETLSDRVEKLLSDHPNHRILNVLPIMFGYEVFLIRRDL